MSVLLLPTAPGPDEVPPTIAVNPDTADVLLLAQLGSLRLCHVVSRLLLPRRTGAGVALCNVSPGRFCSLHLLRLAPLLRLAE